MRNQVDTEQFRRWFEGSEIIDEDGAPLRLYHVTDQQFTEFDPSKRGFNTGFANTNLGFFFLADKGVAEQFGQQTSGGKVVMECYLSIRKPLRLTTVDIFTNASQAPTLWEIFSGERLSGERALEAIDKEVDLGDLAEALELIASDHAKAILERDGYDGVISCFGEGHLEYIAFHPDQIVSATAPGEDLYFILI